MWRQFRSWPHWKRVWRVFELLLAIGIFSIAWSKYDDWQQENDVYVKELKSTYSEALFNKIDAENAIAHFEGGSGTLIRFSVDSAVITLGNRRISNELRLNLQSYIRKLQAKNLALDSANATFQRKCSLDDAELTHIVDHLGAARDSGKHTLAAIASALRAAGEELPATEGARHGTVIEICYPRD